ncbi:MAG: hypothetical protein DRP85_07190 [Candidatus Makaraimicrobium thalassicum]|nr:MAG: hypothetical protein DRP85_07190 [Candidatus Omnitrophota bacterium]
MFEFKKVKKKWILAAGGAAVFMFVLVSMVYIPLVDKMDEVRRKVKGIELRVKEGLRVQMRKDQIQEDYNKYRIYLKQQDYSDQEIVGNFLKELEQIARESNISVISLGPSEPEKEERDYKIYTASLKAEGDMEQVMNFFNGIRGSKLVMKVERFSLAPKAKDAYELKLSAKISMIIP